MSADLLLDNFYTLAEAPNGIEKLRELILQLAMQGKLVPQDPADEPVSELLSKINGDKKRLTGKVKIPEADPLPPIELQKMPYELPDGWKWARLGNIGLIGSSSRVHQKDWKDNGVPFYRAREIVRLSRFGNVDNELFIEEELYQALASRGLIPEPGDVMLTGVGTIGVPYVVKEGDKFYFKDASVIIFKNCFSIYPLYLRYYFKSPFWSIEIHKDSMGTTVDTLTISRANLVPIPLPPISEQRRIVAKVDQLMALCDELEKRQEKKHQVSIQLNESALNKLTTSKTPEEFAGDWQRIKQNFDLLYDNSENVRKLKQAILQLAVQGKLVPQDPKDEPASVLLEKIKAEKERLIKEKKIKKSEPLPPIGEDELPFKLPRGWVWCRLRDIISISSGDGLTSDKMEKTGSIPVFGGNGITGQHDEYNVSEPTIVIGRVGFYCGSVHVTPAKAWVTDNAFITWFLPQFLFMDYLYWLLIGSDLGRNDNATAQPVISGRKVYPIIIGLPPFDEQRRIVGKLIQLMKVCDQLETKLTHTQSAAERLVEAVVRGVVAA